MKRIEDFIENGFAVISDVYSLDEITGILSVIEAVNTDNITFRKSNELFAIRQFLKEVPGVTELVFNDKLISVLKNLFGDKFFVVKSIYFDKPKSSNWYVSYHQDLTISVDEKLRSKDLVFGQQNIISFLFSQH